MHHLPSPAPAIPWWELHPLPCFPVAGSPVSWFSHAQGNSWMPQREALAVLPLMGLGAFKRVTVHAAGDHHIVGQAHLRWAILPQCSHLGFMRHHLPSLTPPPVLPYMPSCLDSRYATVKERLAVVDGPRAGAAWLLGFLRVFLSHHVVCSPWLASLGGRVSTVTPGRRFRMSGPSLAKASRYSLVVSYPNAFATSLRICCAVIWCSRIGVQSPGHAS